jgi:DNA-binding NtrC family response regulator
MSLLLSIIEIGGYPDFTSVYQELGYQTQTVNSVRKAISSMKKQAPAVIVAEFNFQSDFRDRTSNLETLLATIQGQYPECKVIVFYEKEFAPAFARLQQSYPIDCALQFPVSDDDIRNALTQFEQQGTA